MQLSTTVCHAAADDRLHFQVFVGDEFLGDVVMAPGDSLADVRSSITLHFERSGTSPLPDEYTFSQPGGNVCRVSHYTSKLISFELTLGKGCSPQCI